ncbi:MAG: DUF1634 domain-containing protein [Anaerolineae bacterium]
MRVETAPERVSQRWPVRATAQVAAAKDTGDEGHVSAADRVISGLLRYGVLVSVVLVVLGMVSLGLRGNTGYGATADVQTLLSPPADRAPSWPTTLGGVLSGAVQLRPYALILLGLLVLIMTPILRVAVSAVLFLIEHDLLYVAITVFVLAVLVLSFFLGAGHS